LRAHVRRNEEETHTDAIDFLSLGVMPLGFIHRVSNFPVIEHLCHAPFLVLILVVILGLSGFVSGMIGFGFGMVGASVLWILPPREGIPLLMLLSACSQIFSIIQLRSSMTPLRSWWPEGPAPCILGGFLGVPLGLWMLSQLNANITDSIVGLMIMGCACWMIFKSTLTSSHHLRRTLPTALFAGLLSGTIGGLCANPGPVMVIWSNLLGLNKDQQRAVVQPFILSAQLLALFIFLIHGGVFSGCLGILWFSSFAIILITTRLGVMVFRRMSNLTYNRVAIILITISGISLIAKGWGYWSGLFMKLDQVSLSL
jgi:uncharacterized protein